MSEECLNLQPGITAEQLWNQPKCVQVSPHKTLYLVFYCIVALMLMPVPAPTFITVRVCEVEGIWGVEGTHSVCARTCLYVCGLNMGLCFSFEMCGAYDAIRMKVHADPHQHLNCLHVYNVCVTPPSMNIWIGTIGQGIKAIDPSVSLKANTRGTMWDESDKKHDRISAAGRGQSCFFFKERDGAALLHNACISKPMIWWNKCLTCPMMWPFPCFSDLFCLQNTGNYIKLTDKSSTTKITAIKSWF